MRIKGKKIILLAAGLLCFVFYLFFLWDPELSRDLNVSYTVCDDHEDTFQVFYTTGHEWNEYASASLGYYEAGITKKLVFSIPLDGLSALRFDLGNTRGDVSISNIVLSAYSRSVEIDYAKLADSSKTSMGSVIRMENGLRFPDTGDDPYLVYSISNDELKSFYDAIYDQGIFIRVIYTLIAIAVCVFFFFIGGAAINIVKEILNSKSLILDMSVNDFKTKYAGSQFGIVWAFVPPVVTALIYIFVFQIIARAVPADNDYPYALWLIPGMIPWFFFSEAVVSGTCSLHEYGYLVKKVVFNINVLPAVKILSAFFVHVFFVIFVVFIYILAGMPVRLHWIQLPYYMLCVICFSVAIVYFTCAIYPFFKDFGQIVNILLMVGMWMCPIMWSVDMLPEKLRFLISFNPMYYIIRGYRESFMGTGWVTAHVFATFYFWTFTLSVLCLSAIVFKRLRPHFADVL